MEQAPGFRRAGHLGDVGLYETLPLDDDALKIRILEILPGEQAQPIECRLVVTQVSCATRYEALSYTWGTSSSTRTIKVNNRQLRITPNLECALRRLRREGRRRKIWCDAICINQLDLQERATQVVKMGQIYRNAERVLVWLGDGGPQASLAFRYVHWCINPSGSTFEMAAQRCCPLHWWKAPEPAFPGFVCRKCGGQCGCDDCFRTRRDIKDGLADILSRDWWQRMWVVQEVAMAAGDPAVGCGESWISWSDLVKYEAAGHYWPRDRNLVAQIHQIRLDIKLPPRLRGLAEPLAYSSAAAAADDVFHWLRRTANLHASDPRDKLYALLGMARNKRWREFRPDYSISVQDLQYELVSQMILLDKNLDMLSLCRPRFQSHGSGFPTERIIVGETPSWVPDFDAQGLPYLATMEHLTRNSPLRTTMAKLSSMDPPTIDGPQGAKHRTLETLSGIAMIQGQRFRNFGASLKANGFRIDVISDFSNEHQALEKFTLGGTSDPRDLLRGLYFWLPVWRAIDPAYLRIGGEVDTDTFIAKVDHFFADEETITSFNKSYQDRQDVIDRTRDEDERKQLDWQLKTEVKEMKELGESLPGRADNLIPHQRVSTLDLARQGRKFFMTRHGLLGIGPTELQTGDVIAVLHGSSAAYALRRIDAGHILIGNVFADIPFEVLPWKDLNPKAHTWKLSNSHAKMFEIW